MTEKAAVKTPKPPRKNTKGAPPGSAADSVVIGNHTEKPNSTKGVPLNFTVSAEFRKEWHLFARTHDMSGVDLLRFALDLVKQHKGGN